MNKDPTVHGKTLCYSVFAMNQLTGFNSNRLYVYLLKQSPYCKKKGKNWDFLVVSKIR